MAYSPDIVGTDLASRYKGLLPTVSVDRREADLAKDWNDQDTVIGFLASGAQNTIDGIVSDVSSGDPDRIVRARRNYSELQDTLRDNTDKISLIRNYRGGGALAESLRKTAEVLGTNAYNQLEVTLPDGRKTTLGLAFNGEDNVLSDPGKGFRSRGYSDADVSAYLSGEYVASDGTAKRSATLQECARLFMDPQTVKTGAGDAFDRNHVQNREGMRAITSNWDRIDSIFGNGAKKFIDGAHNMFLESGAYEHIIPGLLDVAEARKAKTKETGVQLAASVMSAYRALTAAMVSGPSDDRAGGTARAMTVPRRQMADAAAMKTISFLKRAGLSPDDVFGAKSMESLTRGYALQAYFSANGYDVYARGEGETKSFSDALGEYAAQAAEGTGQAEGSVLDQFFGTDSRPGVYGRINDLVGGGIGFEQVARYSSADPADYWTRVGTAKGRSMSEASDDMADGVRAVLHHAVYRNMMKGKDAGSAVTAIVAEADDALKAGKLSKVEEELDAVFRRSGVGGFGAEDDGARAALVSATFDALASGRRFNFQTLVGNLAFGGSPDASRLSERARQSLRDWYYGAVTAPMQFADYDDRVRAHLTSTQGGGLSAADANAVVVRLNAARKSLIDRFAANGRSFDPTMLDRAVLGLRANYGAVKDEAGEVHPRFGYERPDDVLAALDPVSRAAVDDLLSAVTATTDKRMYDRAATIELTGARTATSTRAREANKPDKKKGNAFLH